ncbi:MAG: phenylacetate--CoA ligase family protein [Streptosporangiaceae bacterium]
MSHSGADGRRDFWNAQAEQRPHDERRADREAGLPERIRKAFRAPFYQAVWSRHQVSPDDYGEPGDLAKFPIVRKDDVREFRSDTGDPYGGLVEPGHPVALVSQSSGTSGLPTFQASSARDAEFIAEVMASCYWGFGIRAGDVVMGGAGGTQRPIIPIQRAYDLIGATVILADRANMNTYVEQLEYFRPQVIGLYTGFLERLYDAAIAMGRDPKRLLSSLKVAYYTGKRLIPAQRKRLRDELQVDIYELGGMGDVGALMADCVAHDGLHLRDDYFLVENLHVDTHAPQMPDEPGELVYTSMVDDAMNYVRWGSEDLGCINTAPCACGRTTARLTVYGRIWERTELNGNIVMPADIEELILSTYGRECAFQLVRDAASGQAQAIRLAPYQGAELTALEASIKSAFGAAIPVERSSESEIVAVGRAKYRQVVDG